MNILEDNLKKKTEMIEETEEQFIDDDLSARKIATLENLVRFYQNSIKVFALESHLHYAKSVETDSEHRFITDKQIQVIEKVQEVATDEQIKGLFV